MTKSEIEFAEIQKEKLVGLLNNSFAEQYEKRGFLTAPHTATDLIAHGVAVQELDGCFRCKDSQKMTVNISNKLIDGVNTGWIGGNLPARFCPFCGRRLPKPPEGE